MIIMTLVNKVNTLLTKAIKVQDVFWFSSFSDFRISRFLRENEVFWNLRMQFCFLSKRNYLNYLNLQSPWFFWVLSLPVQKIPPYGAGARVSAWNTKKVRTEQRDRLQKGWSSNLLTSWGYKILVSKPNNAFGFYLLLTLLPISSANISAPSWNNRYI